MDEISEVGRILQAYFSTICYKATVKTGLKKKKNKSL